ncbi:hypothetical protein TNCV_4566381 [Trichonephila clavipes]|nr:hypothetical protein TNCV_4566381 [Trichonephila clavipes]
MVNFRYLPTMNPPCPGLATVRKGYWHDLATHIHFLPYDITEEHPPFDKLVKFVEWAQNEIAAVPDFHKRILFSDEAHFWLNGYVNKQNCRIWSEANP